MNKKINMVFLKSIEYCWEFDIIDNLFDSLIIMNKWLIFYIII